jgi:type IX secretion system PorP/SprF family membrane protein
MKTLRLITCICGILIAQAGSSQDFHLSLYDAAPMYLNPALTGIYYKYKTDYRIYADYRMQWKALASKPYSTATMAYDMKYKRYGFGGILLNNRSGAGNFNTLMVLGSAAYRITDDELGPHTLTVGLQAGIFYKSFNPNKFTYDTQYSESSNGFDVTIDPGENWDKTGLVKFDANLGVYYKYIKEENKAYPFGGFSIYHLTMPNESFTGFKSKVPMRFVGHAGVDIKLDEENKWKLTPTFLFMNQAKAYEYNLGLQAWYTIKDTDFDVMLGGNYRYKDAFVIQAGLKQKEHIFRISYDVNTSYLNSYSGGRGGIEFSLLLNGVKGEPLFQTKSRM